MDQVRFRHSSLLVCTPKYRYSSLAFQKKFQNEKQIQDAHHNTFQETIRTTDPMHVKKLDNRFTDLFTEAEPMLYRFAFSLCANRSDADDVLQDAMASLWRRFDDYDPKRPFLPWARQFIYQTVLSHRQKYATRAKYLSDKAVELMNVQEHDTDISQEQRLEALKTCLAELKDKDRRLIEHRYAPKTTLDQLATDTNQTVNALSKRLQRLRVLLGKCVSQKLLGEA